MPTPILLLVPTALSAGVTTGHSFAGDVLMLVPAAFVASLACTSVVRRLAPRFGLIDRPAGRKVHLAPTPLGGGVAIYLGLAGPMVVALALFTSITFVTRAGTDNYSFHLAAGARGQTPLALGFLAAMLGMVVLGLFDDRRALGPFVKLAVQLGITTAFVALADVRALTALDHYGLGRVPSVVVTVLWIGAITNAFNFLDNMDGLSAGVAAVCSAAFLCVTLLIGQWFVAAMLALLLGSLLGFLVYNFPPAKIFMGDAGSLLVGFTLGVLTVQTTFLPTGRDLAGGWYAVLAPLVVLALPLYDMVTVSAIRIGRGKSPFVGDTNHFSHRLVARGMSRRTAVLCLYLVTAATSMAAILLIYVPTPFAAWLVFAQTLLILGVVALLEQHPLPGVPQPDVP